MSNSKAENREMGRVLRKEMSRYAVDCGEVLLGFTHGTLTLNGRVRAVKGTEDGFAASLAGMLKMLRSQRGVRDVQTEWTIVY